MFCDRDTSGRETTTLHMVVIGVYASSKINKTQNRKKCFIVNLEILHNTSDKY